MQASCDPTATTAALDALSAAGLYHAEEGPSEVQVGLPRKDLAAHLWIDACGFADGGQERDGLRTRLPTAGEVCLA